MLQYTLSNELRDVMSQYHREVQIAIAINANERLGNVCTSDNHTPKLGIGKFEGGVTVWVKEAPRQGYKNDNGIHSKEICIKYDYVTDDWDRSIDPKPAERAVVNAIHFIAEQVETYGVEWLTRYSSQIETSALFDPLRSMFGW